MLEWTVACSMYLAMPVTNAFLSSKLVLKLGCRGGKQNKDVRLRSEWPAVSRLLGDLPDRAGKKAEAQYRAAGQAEAAPPGGPRWTAHLLASLGQPYCSRTKYRAGCEGRRSLEYTAGLPTGLRWLLVPFPSCKGTGDTHRMGAWGPQVPESPFLPPGLLGKLF